MTDTMNSPAIDLDERAIAAAELKAAEDKLQSLCAAHAGTFVAVEKRGATLTATLKSLLNSLDQALPHVEKTRKLLDLDANHENGSSGSSKEDTFSALAEKHRLRRRTLLQNSNLLELLELPSLMDACVRGHLYEEGLNIASFANVLEKRHLIVTSGEGGAIAGTKNPIVSNVVEEIRKREDDLRRDLLNRLRTDVTMPQCLEIVTALRRLNNVALERKNTNGNHVQSEIVEKAHEMGERKLQIQFLEARDVWLDSAASSVGSSNYSSKNNRHVSGNGVKGHVEILLDSIDIYRTRCFEIATQFIAIFGSTSSMNQKSPGASNTSNQLLNMWTCRRIHSFLQEHLVAKCLPSITDTATLRDALDAVTFFATSMGRVGADFSTMIPSLFEPALFTLVTSHWNDGINAFESILKVCRETGIATPLYSSSRDSIASLEKDDSNDVDDWDNHQRNRTPAPPRQLMALPPLARLLNSYLMGLNELRRCLMPGIFSNLRVYFHNDYVKKIKDILIKNERAVLTPGFLNMKSGDPAKLRSVAQELKAEFDGCVEPYMKNALEVSFGCYDNLTMPVLPSKDEEVIQNNSTTETEQHEMQDVSGENVIDSLDTDNVGQ